jgi:CDP-diacylglycerol--glycerol-3-phosphate 3-phosphatidyltransferase
VRPWSQASRRSILATLALEQLLRFGFPGAAVGIYQIKPTFQRSLRGLEDWLVERRIHPDWLTYAALALSVLGGLCLYFAPQRIWLLAFVPLVAVLRTALNALDGLVAKRTGLARPWGEVLNEFCDRLADVALLGGVALAEPADHLLGSATVVAVLLSSYIAILSKAAGGRRQYAGPMGKADRMVALAVAAALGLFMPLGDIYNLYLAFVLAGVILTMVQRGRATYHDLQPPG